MDGPVCVLFVAAVLLTAIDTASSVACHEKCRCIWQNGKQTAQCPSQEFSELPKGLDEGIQVLNLTKNFIRELPAEAFQSAGLQNVQKLYMSNCQLERIHDSALHRVTNLVEMDLSDNKLSAVPSDSLKHVPHLRTLILSGNPITTIVANAFTQLKELRHLELSNCKLDTVKEYAFEGLDNLMTLKLDSNFLETLPGKAMAPLRSLNALAMEGNQWRCDCELRTFRIWLDKSKIPNIHSVCQKPVRLKGKLWKDIQSDEFSCAPRFLNFTTNIPVPEGSNVTLECRVQADPPATIEWFWKDRALVNYSEGISSGQTFVYNEQGETNKLSWLTISFVQEANAGHYTCSAKNNAGQISSNYTLSVTRRTVTENKQETETTEMIGKSTEQPHKENPLIGMVIGIIVGALAVLIIFGLVLWICRRRRRHTPRKRTADGANNHKVGNSVDHHIAKDQSEDSADMKLLGYNPVQKPPRMGSYQGVPTADLEPPPIESGDNVVPSVWVVKDHVVPDSLMVLPPPRDRRSMARSPIPVPMPVPPEDVHLRLQSELADTLRRKGGDRRPVVERERGDGSSELESAPEYESGRGAPFETLRVKDLERVGLKSEPDLIDHPRRQEISEALAQQQPSPPPQWDPPAFDHPSAYFRPPSQILTSSIMEGGSDGTEV